MLTFALTLLLGSATPPPAPACAPIFGWEEMLDHTEPEYVVIGEMHGNRESPQLFLDAVCRTAARGKVVVALEQSAAHQPEIDAFLASDGGDAARDRFLASEMWRGRLHDGRSSEAMFALFEGLRGMVQAGKVARVVAFIPALDGPYPGPEKYEAAMADAVRNAGGPGVTVLVFTGNVHAMRVPVPWGSKYMPMAGHLPRESTVTLDIMSTGGESWACSGEPMICGPMKIGGDNGDWRRGVVLHGEEDARYSGAVHLGVPTNASAPMVPADD